MRMKDGIFLRKLGKDEEIVIEDGYVYVKKKFDKLKWAKQILRTYCHNYIKFYVCNTAKIVIAFYNIDNDAKKLSMAICGADDTFDEEIGKAIALCRLEGVKIPKEIFE